MTSDKRYIGDGVYAEYDRAGGINLTTERGDGTHYIYLEPEVLDALNAFRREKDAEVRE